MSAASVCSRPPRGPSGKCSPISGAGTRGWRSRSSPTTGRFTGSSTSMSTMRTCASSTGSTPRWVTATSLPSSPRLPGARPPGVAGPVGAMQVVDDITGLIGNTPLVGIHSLSPNPSVRIWAKLEGQNPTGSVKDRIARAMIQGAEAKGELTPDRILLEPTSGNTGISLAFFARRRGYRLVCVMPETASEERSKLIQLFGGHVVYSPGDKGSNGAIRMATEMAEKDPRYLMLYQYGNEANPRAHYETTGPEIVRDLPAVTHVVAGLGTGGTLTGVGRFFSEHRPEVRIVAAEPEQGDLVYGLRSLDEGFIPPVLDERVLH